MKRFLVAAVAISALGLGFNHAHAASYVGVAGSYATSSGSVDGGGSATPYMSENASSFDNGSTVAHSTFSKTASTSYATHNEAGGGSVSGGGIGGFDYAGKTTAGAISGYGVSFGGSDFENF